MPRYGFGPDSKNLDVVEADNYKIDGSFITFLRGDTAILSTPLAHMENVQWNIVGQLDDNDHLPFTHMHKR